MPIRKGVARVGHVRGTSIEQRWKHARASLTHFDALARRGDVRISLFCIARH
jgi:hypothetical protein